MILKSPVYGIEKVMKVVLDPKHDLPDVNRANNIWESGREAKLKEIVSVHGSG